MTTPAQVLAHTIASLLKSCLPFMVLGLLATLMAGLALLFLATSLPVNLLLLIALIFALPIAWVSLRILFDMQIMQRWSETTDDNQCDDFDQALKAVGLIKDIHPRDITSRARGCVGLQKKLLMLVSLQWIIVIAGIALNTL